MGEVLGIVIVFFLLFVFLGIFFLVTGLKSDRYTRKASLFLGVNSIGLAVCFLLSFFLNSTVLFLFSLVYFFGSYLITCFFKLYYLKCCTQPIVATFEDYTRVSNGRGFFYRYAARFSYYYMQKEYVENSVNNYFRRKIKRLFDKGQQYTIYIDPRHPECCADKAGFPFFCLFGGIFGGVFLLISLILLLVLFITPWAPLY